MCTYFESGNELPPELIQTLLKMAPRPEEELKLRLYNGDFSMLGHAERFLKRLVDIPFAFKRLESLYFMCTLQEETSTLKESFTILEVSELSCFYLFISSSCFLFLNNETLFFFNSVESRNVQTVIHKTTQV